MKHQLNIKEASLNGEVLDRISLEIENEIISVKELIEIKVVDAIDAYNKKGNKRFFVFDVPGERNKPIVEIDKEQAVYKALDAFTNNAFVVFVDGKQTDALDDEILVEPDTDVRFIKLTPLIGG